MGRKKLEFKVDLIDIKLSQEFHQFLFNRKGERSEPLYRVADRLMTLYKMSDKAELEEQVQNQKKIIAFYYERIKKLEAGKQTVLIE